MIDFCRQNLITWLLKTDKTYITLMHSISTFVSTLSYIFGSWIYTFEQFWWRQIHKSAEMNEIEHMIYIFVLSLAIFISYQTCTNMAKSEIYSSFSVVSLDYIVEFLVLSIFFWLLLFVYIFGGIIFITYFVTLCFETLLENIYCGTVS